MSLRLPLLTLTVNRVEVESSFYSGLRLSDIKTAIETALPLS